MPNAYRLAGTMTTCLRFSKVEMRLPYWQYIYWYVILALMIQTA